MSYRNTFFINSTDFLTATSVFEDEGLTTLSPDGFYRNGLYVRQQVEGVLLPAQICNCPPDPSLCGVAVDVIGAEGVFVTEVDTGADTGYIVVKFNPASIPMGIKVEFDGTIYNTFFSGRVGVLTGLVNEPVFLGQLASDCGILGEYTRPEYRYLSGDYVLTGDHQDITVTGEKIDLTELAPSDCIMVIPKPSASPSVVKVTIYGLCPDGSFFLQVSCPPDSLTEVTASEMLETEESACIATKITTYYKTGSAYVTIDDMVFSDHGVTILPAGFYGYISGYDVDWFHINDFGIVDDMGVCELM